MTLKSSLTVHDLAGLSLYEVLGKLERGKVGHLAVMDWLGIDSYPRLVEIMHHNGRRMPGHIPMKLKPETIAIVRQALGLPAKPRAKSAAASAKRPAARKSASKSKREV
jgi:hypothetical protein